MLRVLGFVMRFSNGFGIAALKSLFCSLVRSIFEYCTVASNLYCQKYVSNWKLSEHRLGVACSTYDYDTIRRHMGSQRLEFRTVVPVMTSLLTLHRIITGNFDCPVLLSTITFNVWRVTRNQELFCVPCHSTNYGYYSSVARMLRIRNVCNEIDLFCSVA